MTPEKQAENERKAIENLQRYLLQLSYFDPRIPAVPIDGVWGNATAEAVRAFQRAEDLDVTGTVDRVTFERLLDAYRKSVALHAAPLPLAIFPRFPASGVIAPGEESRTVFIIQFILSELAIVFAEGNGPALTGVFDEATEASVRRFQKRSGLPVTGAVDKTVWDALARAFGRDAAYSRY